MGPTENEPEMTTNHEQSDHDMHNMNNSRHYVNSSRCSFNVCLGSHHAYVQREGLPCGVKGEGIHFQEGGIQVVKYSKAVGEEGFNGRPQLQRQATHQGCKHLACKQVGRRVT